jgi:DNA-binding NtrC family response regulator
MDDANRKGQGTTSWLLMTAWAGEDLGEEMMRIRPDIPVILCTGYPDLNSSEKATAMGFRGFIIKPFGVREGVELVRRGLDQKKPGDR